MINRLWYHCKGLKARLLLSFFAIISIVVTVTLYVVQNTTYQQATRILLTHSEAASAALTDHFENQISLVHAASTNLAADFSVKKLIQSASQDTASLALAMENFQKRFNASWYAVLTPSGQITSTNLASWQHGGVSLTLPKDSQTFWLLVEGKSYLVSIVAVKNTPRSRQAMAWVLFALDADNLLDDAARRMTSLDISLVAYDDNTFRLMSSPYEEKVVRNMLSGLDIASETLYDSYVDDEHYLFTMTPLDNNEHSALWLLLSTLEANAYVSYYNLLGQLLGVLLAIVLGTAMVALMLAQGITRPIKSLIHVTQKIRQHSNSEVVFPRASITEVNTLSLAFDEMLRDIQSHQREITSLAFTDQITGLPNRNQFLHMLGEALQRGENVSVILVDLRGFREVNDTIGHTAGDELLKRVGHRLQQAGTGKQRVARLGGDEFAVMLLDTLSTDAFCTRVQHEFSVPIELNTLMLEVHVCMGTATAPKDATEAGMLMQCADIALHHAKSQRQAVIHYDSQFNTFSLRRLKLMTELKSALTNGEIRLYYQPKICTQTRDVKGVECLIRWIHPEHGFIAPDEFIPLAEQTGNIRLITQWAIREALQQHHVWRQSGWIVPVAVNISALDLVDLSLPFKVSSWLTEWSLPASSLLLEVTESSVMSDPDTALKALSMLDRMGIALSIDDFGTGYSSMAQLKKMPVSELKIDKAFVLRLAQDDNDKTIVRTLIAMANSFSLATVAEGVEDDETLALLAQMSCTKAQGFGICRPLPADEISLWLASHLRGDE